MNIDAKAIEEMNSVEFSFEVLYDAQKIGVESLFVMVFENLEAPEEPIRLWIYLDRYMACVQCGLSLTLLIFTALHHRHDNGGEG